MRVNGLVGVVQLVVILLVGSPGSRFGMLLGTTASCGFMSTNKRTSSEAMEFFNTQVNKNFVGQYRAVQNLRGALHDHLEMGNGPLVLHLVGPSGTGKSYLTELMSKAVFDDCKDVTSKVLGGMRAVVTGALDSLPSVFDGWGFKTTGKDLVQRATRRECPPKQRLDDWRQACGIVYTSFHDDTAETGGGNHKVLSQFLEAAAQELKIEPNSVLIMDDFNFCKRDCGTMLKDLLSQHIIRTRSGEVVSASKAVIVFCSDLTNMGLVLDSSLDYDNALKLVEEAADTFWGSDSVVITKSIHLPFAPLRPAEFTRIIDSIISSTREVIEARVRKYLGKAENDLPYEWNGQLVCEESTKQQIVDRLHGQTEITNARAITEVFKERLRLRLTKPTPIEKRLGEFKLLKDKWDNNKDIWVKIQPGTSELELILEIQ